MKFENLCHYKINGISNIDIHFSRNTKFNKRLGSMYESVQNIWEYSIIVNGLKEVIHSIQHDTMSAKEIGFYINYKVQGRMLLIVKHYTIKEILEYCENDKTYSLRIDGSGYAGDVFAYINNFNLNGYNFNYDKLDALIKLVTEDTRNISDKEKADDYLPALAL